MNIVIEEFPGMAAFRALQKTLRGLKQNKPELGEFPLPNVYSQMSRPTAQTERTTPTMARHASATKVSTIKVETLNKLQSAGEFLTEKGFSVESFQHTGEGDLISVTCWKDETKQVITPQIIEMLKG